MSMHDSQPKIKTPELLPLEEPTRRAFMAALAASGVVAAATPAASKTYAVTVDGDMGDQIAYHVEQIAQLLNADAPDGAVLRGFDFRCLGGEVLHDSIWASAINEDCRLYSARPCVYEGWRNLTPKFAGGSV